MKQANPRITFQASPADVRWLKAQAKANHTTVSQLVRATLRRMMENSKRPR